MGLKELAVRVIRKRRRTLPGLDERITCFREVLHANNAALGHIARIQQALAGEVDLTAGELRTVLAGVTVQTYRMIINLNRMTARAHSRIIPTFERLKAAIQSRTEMSPVLSHVGFVLPLVEVGAGLAEQVGQKSANLGEAMRLLGGHVPAGFAITVEAYRAFVEGTGLAARIREIVEPLDARDIAASFRASAQVTLMIESAEVPPRVAAAIERAVESLPEAHELRLAVRSSALQEGGLEMSFAGQYRSLLNIPPHGVVDAFKRVVASKYSPQALTYRVSRGFTDDEVAMCCCVIAMVDATAAGVLYSAYQTETGASTLLQAVRGLGLSAVDGSAEPDTYVLDRKQRRVVSSKLGRQTSLLQMAAAEGTEKLAVAAAAGRAILTEAQALEIASLAWRLESALAMPIDMEWAVGRSGEVSVLQVRPQPAHADDARPRRARLPGIPVLVDGGSRASGGAAAGAVYRVESDLDILRCPPSTVVVTSEANPRLAVLLPQAAAIVADLGEVTGHLATVARELKVPALFATRTATATLPAREVVTVDADAGVVYAGRVGEVLARPATTAPVLRPSPQRDRLASVADLIVPLTLRDRLASGYSPAKCSTLHDIIRFCHQATVEAMFALGDRAMRHGDPLRRLVSDVPIDCRLFDLGGGLRPGIAPGDVSIDDVVSLPLRALWRGMTDPRLHWTTVRPVSLKGFVSAVVNYNFDQDQRMRPMGEPSYAFISDAYMNLNSRIGYHFSTVDAHIGEMVESNYASFRFVGGSTGVEQRSRRATLIQHLLSARGFETDCRADLVNARIRHLPAAEMEDALVHVGLVMGYVNHLDMALTSDGMMRCYEAAFLTGDYGFKRREPDAPTG